jgi:hypothetical protein
MYMRTYAHVCLAVYEIHTKNTQLQEPVEILFGIIFCKTVVNIRWGGGGEGGVCAVLKVARQPHFQGSFLFSRLFKNLKSSDNNQAQASE